MSIQNWIDTFFTGWRDHDIDMVLSLFADEVEYWETPFLQIPDKDALRDVWQYILTQSDIMLSYDIFAAQDNKYTVHWSLQYKTPSSQKKEFSGIYLLELDADGKCSYFLQCGEQKL